MQPQIRLSLGLWLAGFAGIASILLLDFAALVALLPESARAAAPRITPGLKFLSLIQPAVFLTLAVYAGATFAPKVGLSAPVAEAWAVRRPLLPTLRPQWVPGALGGLTGGIAIVLIAALANPLLPPGAPARIAAFGGLMPVPTRLLYGGITEEVLLRWGLMSLLAWAAWRVFQKSHPRPPAGCFHAAILLSAVIFGAGHLPVAFLIVPEPNFALVVYVVVANAVFGVVAGYLFWKRGLESAILAHMITHVTLYTASQLGTYY